GTENDRRASFGFFRISRELARDRDHAILGHAGDCLLPRRCVRHVLVIGFGDVFPTETTVNPVICDQEIEDGGDYHLVAVKLEFVGRNPPDQYVLMRTLGKILVLSTAKIWEGNCDPLRLR